MYIICDKCLEPIKRSERVVPFVIGTTKGELCSKCAINTFDFVFKTFKETVEEDAD